MPFIRTERRKSSQEERLPEAPRPREEDLLHFTGQAMNHFGFVDIYLTAASQCGKRLRPDREALQFIHHHSSVIIHKALFDIIAPRQPAAALRRSPSSRGSTSTRFRLRF